ncbi:hypothetical protein MRX96_032877 [Rhipicephalus microplus]
MNSGQCLTLELQQHGGHPGGIGDGDLSACIDAGEDTSCLNVSGIENSCMPRSACPSIIETASASITGFPVIMFSSWWPVRFLYGPGRFRSAAYWSEFDECTDERDYRGAPSSHHCNNAVPQLKQARLERSLKQPGLTVDDKRDDHAGTVRWEQRRQRRRSVREEQRELRQRGVGPAHLRARHVERPQRRPSRPCGNSLRYGVHNEFFHGFFHVGWRSRSRDSFGMGSIASLGDHTNSSP